METLRQRLREYLRDGPRSIREISQELRISEKEALSHLEHLAKGAGGPKGGAGERLNMVPASCRSCGYVFRKRQRLRKPGRCPVCRGENLAGPSYVLSAPGEGRGRGPGRAGRPPLLP